MGTAGDVETEGTVFVRSVHESHKTAVFVVFLHIKGV